MRYHSVKSYLEKFIPEKLTTLLGIVLPSFLVFLAYLYLTTYYYFFDIDIFSYISINTIVLYAVKSIGLVVVLSIVGFLFMFLYNGLIESTKRPLKWISQNMANFLPERWTYLTLFTIVLLFIAMIFIKLYSQWIDIIFDGVKIRLLLKTAILLTMLILGVTIINKFINNDHKGSVFSPKVIVASILLSIVTLTIGKAYLDAITVINETNYQYVMASDLKGDYPDKKLKLVGKADNHYFLKYPDKKGILVKQFDDFKELHLRTFRDTSNTDN